MSTKGLTSSARAPERPRDSLGQSASSSTSDGSSVVPESRWGPRARGQVWIDVAVGRGVGGGEGGLPVFSVKQEAGLCLQVGLGICGEEV